MLNTDSGAAKALIWLSIIFILAASAWSFWTIPAPATLISNLLASDLAEFAARNQFWLTGLLGFGGASLAYVLNGWRDRSERRHVSERAIKRDAAVLASEAREIATACQTAIRDLASRNPPVTATVADLKAAMTASDHLLLAATTNNLARLGATGSAAARAVRASLRRLAEASELAGREDVAASQALIARAQEAARTAHRAASVFDAVATGGPAAADRLRHHPNAPEAETVEPGASSDAGKSPRLHTAA